MSQVPTRVLAARVDRMIVLQFAGQVTAEFCPAVRAFCADESTDPPAAVAVYLQDVEHFDSTFLGTLLCLRSRFGDDCVVLISPGEQCDAGLRRMGAHLLFPIQEDSLPENVEWTNLSDRITARDAYDFQHNVVEAHLELARTPGPMQKVYEPIARQAEREFAQRHGWDSLSTVRLPRQRVGRSD
ncbi:MAG: STAS domain-containing protein [Planctomycetaceae bacterium]